MDSQGCVHCLNKKQINSTTNRLVTESCGHVKCMDCLLHEKAGCVACVDEASPKEPEDTPEPSEGPPSDADNIEHEPVQSEFPLKHFLSEADIEKEVQTEHGYDKKRKPETSHIRIETDGNSRYYYCTACKRKFQARSQVAYHAYCNGQQKPYQCPECSKSFATHSHFKYHMRVHRNERTYACELCGDSFFQMSKLQRHKLKHTKEKKYACSECSKAFNNLSSLRKHALTHTEERPYGCETCGRRFRDSSNYRKHVAKHQGASGAAGGCAGACRCGGCGRRRARAHQCPRCPQAFHARKDMRRHAAVHTDSKPFRCSVCSRRFRRKDNLERHVRNTHPAHAPAHAPARAGDDAPATRHTHHTHHTRDRDKLYQSEEKTKLEILNPLPPLPPEVIQKHLDDEVKPQSEKEARDKSLAATILAANIARQSVIFGPVRCAAPAPALRHPHPAPAPGEYVHKIRKANVMARRLHQLLPPIDETKIRQLERLDHQNNLDVGAPPERFRELYKKILYSSAGADRDAAPAPDDELHWRKKMKLSINW